MVRDELTLQQVNQIQRLKRPNTPWQSSRLCVRWWILFCVCGWVLLFGSFDAQAQQTQIAYGKACNTAGSCAFGLVCSLTVDRKSGFCVPQCNFPTNAQQVELNSAQCPRREPCRRPTFEKFAGCFCLKDSECPTGQSCLKHQCSAPLLADTKVGEICDAKKICGRGLLCTNPVFASEFRCFPFCKTSCGTAGQCLKAPSVVGHNKQSASFTACVCRKNSDCSSGICFDNVCRKTPKLGEPCTTASGCAGQLFCHFANQGKPYGRCHPRCFANSTCLAGETCVGNACVCSSSSPCKFGGVCQQGVCTNVDRCTVDNDCQSKRCFKPVTGESSQGICLTACNVSSDCSRNTPCLQLSGSGRACYCSRDSDCPNNRACTEYRCGAQKPTTRLPPIPKPQECKPACQYPFSCKDGTCVKRNIGEACTKAIECKGGVCFGPNKDSAKICSVIVSDCSQCLPLRLKCATFDGVQACYLPDNLGISVFPEPPETGCKGCQSSDQAPSWFLLPLLFVWVMVRRLQR